MDYLIGDIVEYGGVPAEITKLNKQGDIENVLTLTGEAVMTVMRYKLQPLHLKSETLALLGGTLRDNKLIKRLPSCNSKYTASVEIAPNDKDLYTVTLRHTPPVLSTDECVEMLSDEVEYVHEVQHLLGGLNANDIRIKK